VSANMRGHALQHENKTNESPLSDGILEGKQHGFKQ